MHWLAYSFWGLVHYLYGGKKGSMQAHMMLEKEMRVFTSWPFRNIYWSETLDSYLSIGKLRVFLHSDTLFNHKTKHIPIIVILSLRPIFFQTTIPLLHFHNLNPFCFQFTSWFFHVLLSTITFLSLVGSKVMKYKPILIVDSFFLL